MVGDGITIGDRTDVAIEATVYNLLATPLASGILYGSGMFWPWA